MKRAALLFLVLVAVAAAVSCGDVTPAPRGEALPTAAPLDAGPPLPPTTPVAQIAAAGHSTCARLPDGTVRCWGELGGGAAPSEISPRVVPALSSVGEISLGPFYACVRTTGGEALCWGTFPILAYGEDPAPDAAAPTHTATPALVPGLSGIAEIALGWGHVCAFLTDTTVRCWGRNNYGQLGDGTTTDSLTPSIVPGLTGVTQLALGYYHTCARLADGTATCWGSNAWGQLGDDTGTNHATPTTVPGLSAVAEVALGVDHTCARLADGTARCWGMNSDGQLGDGTTTDRARPAVVAGLSDVAGLALGFWHSCAWLRDGTARCWGSNDFDELGARSTPERSTTTPGIVVGLSGVAEMALGYQHTCARRTDGAAMCWGLNQNGQLGDGTTTGQKTPTMVKF